MSLFQYGIVGLCFVLNFNDGIDIMLVSYASPEIIAEWGLEKVEMGYVFSAALSGMTLGCLFLAPLSDRWGRRKVFVLALFLESLGMLGISVCQDFTLLLALRFLTGLGIGGLLPTMAATASEFSIPRLRDFHVSLVQAGWPVGAILTGFFCAWYIPVYGWRSTFVIAGILSLVMLILVLFFMTDSEEYLLKKRPRGALGKVNALREKMGQPALDALGPYTGQSDKPGWVSLFSRTFREATIKSWVAVFFGFMTLYTMLSWIPTLAKEAGLSFEEASFAGVALNVGAAIGSAAIGALGARYGLRKVILSFMILAFIMMVAYANLAVWAWVIFLLAFLIGVFVQGGFNGIWPVLARIYPANIRATGTGFAVGMGRFGAILGPTLFGFLQDSGLQLNVLFILFSIPMLIMGAAIWAIRSKAL